jgi:hypothetical protein
VAGYATGTPVYAETDPVWQAEKGGYATGTPLYVESDPVWAAASNGYYTKAQANALFATGTPLYVESDPVFGASVASLITATDTGHWSLAHFWGNHAVAGYATGTPVYAETDPVWQAEKAGYATGTPLYVESDPVWQAASNGYYTKAQANALFATGTPLYVESDPVFGASVAAAITAGMTQSWTTAYGWGNHASAGYATGTPVYAETDPVWRSVSNSYYTKTQANALFATGTPVYVEADAVYTSSVAAKITAGMTQAWTTAYGWGNHASAGYITGAAASNSFVKKAGDTMTGALALPAGGLVVGTSQFVAWTNGCVGIGVATPTNTLAVNGTIVCKEIVATLSGWPDYVFHEDYRPLPLDQVEQYIRENGHLPGVPSAAEVVQGGVKLGEMQAVLLRKVEELTLHVIELRKQNLALKEALAVRTAAVAQAE